MNRQFAATLLILLAIALLATQAPSFQTVGNTSQVNNARSFAQVFAQDAQVDVEKTSASPKVSSMEISSGGGGFLWK
jgi:hypothetical protein